MKENITSTVDLGHVYTIGERDLVLALVDALHVGNEGVFVQKCETTKDSNGMTCYAIEIACPEKRQDDLRRLLAMAFKIFNF